MKTAYELAIERLGGAEKKLTQEQKKELAEIDRVYDAKVAEAKIGSESRLKEASDDPEKEKQVREELAEELARLDRKREDKKDAVRRSDDE